MISDMHGSSYVLFSINLISHTSLHAGRPLLRPFLIAYAEATLATQKKIAQQTKSVDIISVGVGVGALSEVNFYLEF